MELTHATKREFLRRVYRAAALMPASRDVWLDVLSDTASKSLESGKLLTGTTAGDASASFLLFSSWNPSTVLDLVDWARSWIGPATIDLALTALAASDANSQVTEYCVDFNYIRR